MPDILVLYYSSYGHVEAMAHAQADGARRAPDAHVEVKRTPELVPQEIARTSGFRLQQAAPVAEPAELERYDAILFGTPTRFGCAALWSGRWAASSAAPRVSTGDRRRPSRRSIRHCCITA